MSEPEQPSEPPRAATADGPPPGDAPPAIQPYLLVLPTMEGAPPPVPWPGAEGWAIPVTVPPGTQGYALFLPLVPGGAPTPGVPSQATAPAVENPTSASPTSASPTKPADAAPAAENPTGASPTKPADAAPAVESRTGTSPTKPADAAPVGEDPAGASPTGPTVSAATGAGPVAPGAAPTTAAVHTVPTAGAPDSPPVTAGHVSPTVHGAAAPPVPGPGHPDPRPWVHYPPAPGWAARPPTPRTSFLGARWPGPKPATGRAVPLAVLAGALGSAIFVPLSRVGIGWFLGWLTLTVAVLLAVRPRAAELPRTDRLIRAGWAVAALALLAVPAFRNAWWLVTFCVLGALGCATLAIVGGRLVRSILFGLLATPFAALRGLPWVRRHVAASPQVTTVRKVTVSVVATLVVLVVFGSLLASADAAFAEALGALVPEVEVGSVFRGLFLAAVGGLIAVAAVYTLAAPPDLSTVDRPGRRRLGLLEWAPAIGALTLLFAGFVVVQFTVLFGGQRHVQKVAGLSYAEYARSGFWQLLFVTLLTVAVLGGVTRWAGRERSVERTLLRVLLGLLSALSVVIVASALSRMWAYQKVYSFTGERIFVMAFELMLGAVFLMILAAGVRWQGRWIPGATVALAVAMLLGLAVLNPEDYAARRNTLRYEQTGKIDAWYLRALSADATPALTRLPDPVRRCTLSWIADELDEPDPWYAWNLGRHRARQALDRVGPDAVGGPKDCRRADQFDLPKTRRPR
ncbi:DUF4173 domain-containing protein [Micromonospora sp. WMMD1128]|uniref:DUF4153 domain-containing protein n=1 Tax=Micromonospora sp. WMMD1128 TaxID=3015150 RepID=UPI00248C943D|nr:DUF4153 domain-containing protein [Micromonospora sp. WMMD1128]WBB72651.1 DUF4173 domain-containing protein [Micromonospora sp. WMMD1128]